MAEQYLTILPALKTTLEGITKVKGYHNDIAKVDYEFKLPQELAATQFPALLVVPNMVMYQDRTSDYTSPLFRAYIFGYINAATGTTTKLLQLAADTFKALALDSTIGDKADYVSVITLELAGGVFQPFGLIGAVNGPYAAFRMDIEIQSEASKTAGG